MTRVLVVDDQPLIREAVRSILGAEPGVEVVGEAADGIEALAAAARLRPDIVLMDIRMPRLDGIAATVRIRADPALEHTRILVLTTFEEDAYVVAALRAGASGFIGKAAEPDDIVRAVAGVARGDALLSGLALRALVSRFVAPAASDALAAPIAALTDREREVLLLVARGRSNAEISADLVISPHTTKTHVNRVMSKLGAHDRAQLVIAAYESGLLRAGEP
jgi:DNA-binding NarL/FixJ family response regulator